MAGIPLEVLDNWAEAPTYWLMAVGFATMGLMTSTPPEKVAEELCVNAYAAGATSRQASAIIAAAMKQGGGPMRTPTQLF